MDAPPPVLCLVCGSQAGPPAAAPACEPDTPVASPALDLRPAAADLAELGGWVACCPRCGYSNCELDQPVGGETDTLAELVTSAEYQAVLRDPRYPPLANHFRCMARLQLAAPDDAERDLAALSLLYAAWVCDDAAAGLDTTLHPAQAEALARQLRRETAAILRGALDCGRAVVVDLPTSWLVLSDIYRRAGEFASGHTAAVRGLAASAENQLVEALLRFEQQLIEAQETGAISVSDAFEPDPQAAPPER